jgi:predicted NUDIX family NTP pyrophosphohydrolase
MPKKSAGILLFRFVNSEPEVFLVHPGGPFWAKKDLNSWSVPKGEFDDGEDPLDAARREFEEETGITLTADDFIQLIPIRQKSGKQVFCYACKGDLDVLSIRSNTFDIEWPPESGSRKSFPEIDRGEWFAFPEAKRKIIESQAGLIDQLSVILRIK